MTTQMTMGGSAATGFVPAALVILLTILAMLGIVAAVATV